MTTASAGTPGELFKRPKSSALTTVREGAIEARASLERYPGVGKMNEILLVFVIGAVLLYGVLTIINLVSFVYLRCRVVAPAVVVARAVGVVVAGGS